MQMEPRAQKRDCENTVFHHLGTRYYIQRACAERVTAEIHSPSRRRSMKLRRCRFEKLDRRNLLAATVWVAEAWALESAGKLQFPVTLTQAATSTIKVNFTTVA